MGKLSAVEKFSFGAGNGFSDQHVGRADYQLQPALPRVPERPQAVHQAYRDVGAGFFQVDNRFGI